MIDFGRIVGFQWDEGNRRKNWDRHSVAEAEQVFTGERFLIAEDVRHSQSEVRYHILGTSSEGRYLHVTFTLREDATLIRVISARDMNRKERTRYDRET